LTATEVASLNRSQIVIGSQKHRNPRSRPYAFTERGVAMLSSVLSAERDWIPFAFSKKDKHLTTDWTDL
jgi:hypothetical protein